MAKAERRVTEKPELMGLITKSTDFLGKRLTVKIDRPINSRHPKFGWLYHINYGFVPDTTSPDGEELDVYVLGIEEPLNSFTGVCIAIIRRIDDDDDKLIVVPENLIALTDSKIREMTNFQEQYFKSKIIRSA